MSSKRLFTSPEAVEDLKAIHQFGLCSWGQLQSAHYIEALKEHVWTLAEVLYRITSYQLYSTEARIDRSCPR